MEVSLFIAACFLAYSNGANDNFKGVASLFGSRTASYRAAIGCATVATFGGSLCAIYLAQGLLKAFSGRGLVPDRVAASESFLLAVALGAGMTVIAATYLGFPVSTTHALIGAIIGSGWMAAGSALKLESLAKAFLLPMMLSPLLAVALTGPLYVLLRSLRVRLKISKEWCLCIGAGQFAPMPQGGSAAALQAATPALAISTGESAECMERYAGHFLGVNAQKLMDAAHYLSAGVVSFARGLNDTPKIAALLLVIKALDIRLGMIAIAVAIAIGGLLSAKRVAETMSLRITSMNHGQGLTANLSTGVLVILASAYGLPVSTTHVSVGALFGVGLVRRTVNARVALTIVLSWVLTLPCAVASGIVWWSVIHRLRME
jgi:PiT family inorganic phosphate transporter